MTNKDRKKKVIKWLLIGIGCIALFGVLNGIDSIIVSYNQSAIMEYRVSGGAVSPNTISRGGCLLHNYVYWFSYIWLGVYYLYNFVYHQFN